MQDRALSDSSDVKSLAEVLGIIEDLANKTANGNYIYRGEPDCYPLITSSLFREYPEIQAEYFNIDLVERAMLDEAKEFVGPIDDAELLTQLQHFGYNTNLVDFTTDYNVALFFACDSLPDKDGRVILVSQMAHRTMRAKNPANRIVAQKSIFVIPQEGFVEPDQIVVISRNLKGPILEYLRKSHDIRQETIYNDLHGFIRYRKIHGAAFGSFYSALSHMRKGELKEALASFSRAIELNPRLAAAYANRGLVNRNLQRYSHAIEDHTRAIELEPGASLHYASRANAYSACGEYARAIMDHSKTIELAPNSASHYSDRATAYKDMKEYDLAIQDYDKAIQLDSSIAAIIDNRGVVYNELGLPNRAIQDHQAAIDMDPHFSRAYSNRGAAYWHKGDYISAAQDFDKAIQLDGGFAIAYYNRAESWILLGEWGKARADLTSANHLGLNVAAAFRGEFGTIDAFEREFQVNLPNTVIELLAPAGQSPESHDCTETT